MNVTWPARSVLAGTAGTAALSARLCGRAPLRRGTGPARLRRLARPGPDRRAIMHLPHVTARDERELGLALRWGYGSAFGLWHGLLRRRFGEPWASAAFGAR